MNIKCEVIKDLLPLYVDGVVSEESRALIEEHLKECEDCREYLKLLQEDIPQTDEIAFADETASLRKIKHKINLSKLLIAMITLGFAIIVGVVLFNLGLTTYEGSLEENLSYELPAGYEEYVSKTDTGNIPAKNYRSYVRNTADKQEFITLCYNGLDADPWFAEDKVIQLDDSTKVTIDHYDSGHDRYNTLSCKIQHDGETYVLDYSCKETDKKNYYSSCSEAQEEEIVAFIKTFDYHRPDGSDLSIFQKLYRNLGMGGLVLLLLTLLIFIGVPIAIAIGGALTGTGRDEDISEPVGSKDLHEAMNRERKAKGETTIPSINNVQGASSNTLARRDHSWSSVPDFFIKLFRRK